MQSSITVNRKKKQNSTTTHDMHFFFEFIQSDFGTSKEYFKKISNKIVDTLSIK